jgi:hypothetical protein
LENDMTREAIWEFRDGRISRENVWLDGAAITAQLRPTA